MKQEEIERVAAIMLTTDHYCQHCAEELHDQLKAAFPEHAATIARVLKLRDNIRIEIEFREQNAESVSPLHFTAVEWDAIIRAADEPANVPMICPSCFKSSRCRPSEIGNLSCGDCLMNKTEVVHFVALDSEVGHAVAADLRAKFFAPRAQR